MNRKGLTPSGFCFHGPSSLNRQIPEGHAIHAAYRKVIGVDQLRQNGLGRTFPERNAAGCAASYCVAGSTAGTGDTCGTRLQNTVTRVRPPLVQV